MQSSDALSASTPAIVLLEHTSDVQIVLCRLLRDFTKLHEIVIVSSVEQALAQLTMRPVVLLIADETMSTTKGIALAT
jgi:hypothetical protein